MDAFNEISKFGALMVLDARPASAYQDSHIPRAINVPLTEADTDLDQVTKKIERAEQRTFARRQRSHVIVYGEGAALLSEMLGKEGKVASVRLLEGGYEAFHRKFPFLSCCYKPEERASGKHNHLPPFPWYPNEIIDDRVYLGNHVDASNKLHLEHLQIRRVMNVSNDVANLHPEHFQYVQICLPDNEEEDISQFFDTAFSFLDEAERKGERVLIHCHQGVSRSATILLAYLMRKRSWSLKQSYTYVKDKRKQIFPNIGFWRQLERFETGLHGVSTLHECVDMELMEQELKNKKAGLNPDGTGVPRKTIEEESK